MFFLLGTFGRIFHGILVDEKDPNKEKQTFVKTVTVSIKLKDDLSEDKIYFFSALPQTNKRIKMNK